uniref:Globin family profile domain-containing protein n=1 Tax=Panagrolaimus sp. PS1159 TaxID=55785 RepID=A0AC35G4N1_9BILA
MDIVNDIAPELRKLFGVDRAPKATMLKMPKFGGHVSRMTDFLEQMTSMLGFTENIVGAWQLARKTGRLHVKVGFLEENQNQLEKNFFTTVTDFFIVEFIKYLTGEREEPNPAPKDEDKKNVRFQTNYSNQQITDTWRRFFTLIGNQFTESFEIERQKSLSSESKKTLAPHQHFKEEADKKKRIKERQSEIDNATTHVGSVLKN